MGRPAKPIDEDRLSRLLDVAAEEFLARGYEQASLNRILERSGVAKSSFYHYFGDKAGLLETLARSAGEGFDELLRPPEPGGRFPGMGAVLRDTSDRLAALARDRPRAVTLGHLIALPDLPEVPAVRSFRAAVGSRVLRLLLVWRRRGEISAVLPLRLQLAALLAVVQVADRWVLDRNAAPDAAAQAEELIAQFLRGPNAGDS